MRIKKTLALIIAVLVATFSLTACGAPESSGDTAQSYFGEFEDVGINPNNIKNGYAVIDGENMYYASDNSIKKLNLSTGENEKILIAGSEDVAFESLSKELNLYNGYLYYCRDGCITRMNLEDKTEEIVVDKPEDRADIEGSEYITWDYTGFSYYESIFIAKDYLFYWETSGWSNTSGGTSRKLYAKNLSDGKEILIIENSISTSVVEDFYYTIDDEYIYLIAETFMNRVSFESIKNGNPIVEEEYYGFNAAGIPIFGIKKFYYLAELYDDYTWRCFDHKSNELKDITKVDDSVLDTYDLARVSFGIGDKIFSITNQIVMYDFNDITKNQIIYENDSTGIKRPGVSAIYNDKIYSITEDGTTLLTIDGEGDITQTTIIQK